MSTKAAIFERLIRKTTDKPDVEEPKSTDQDALARAEMCGENPIDHMVISSAVPIKPSLKSCL
jgi:hypothetical protein